MKRILLLGFSLGFALCVGAQDRAVTGSVKSKDDGSPLPGVNVQLKGTTNGTVSDAEGKYTINVSKDGGILIFSFIGFATQEVAVGDRTIVDIQLANDNRQLTEVVVTAQGIQTEKKALGFAVTTVSGNVLTQRPEADVARLLSGKVPGVSITQTNGMSGTGTNIVIRGYTSLSGTNQPLFVLSLIHI